MIILEDFSSLPDWGAGTVITIGNFDGVHLGHARLIERAVALAREEGLTSVVFTFDPPPAAVLHSDRPVVPLTDKKRKIGLFSRFSPDVVAVFPADRDFLSLSWEQFLQEFLWDKFRVRAIVEGPDFRFGRGREGDCGRLQMWADQHGVRVEIVEAVRIDGEVVSSSRIRRLLAAGDLATVNRLLVEPYRVRGRVTRGTQRGRKLGYPTANLSGITTLLPPVGIYAGRAYIPDRSAVYAAAISIGPNPTFHESVNKFEVYLLGFDGDLYEQELEVEFLERLRDVLQFDSVEALIEQMHRDVDATRRIAAAAEPVFPVNRV